MIKIISFIAKSAAVVSLCTATWALMQDAICKVNVLPSLQTCVRFWMFKLTLLPPLTDLRRQQAELWNDQTDRRHQSHRRYGCFKIKTQNVLYGPRWVQEEVTRCSASLTETMLPYQAEFFIKLREIEKVLPSVVQDEIKQDLQKLWDTEELEVVNITNALDRGGRVPLPLAGHFEG